MSDHVRGRFPEDEASVRAFRAGHARGFDELFLRYRDRLYAQAYRQLRDRGLAQDVVQEAFMALLKVLPTWEFRAPMGAWLSETTWRLCQSQRRKRVQSLVLEPVASVAEDRTEDLDEIWAAVAHLAPREREAVLLRYGQGLSMADIAHEMGITEKAVSSHLSTAVAKLRQKIRS